MATRETKARTLLLKATITKVKRVGGTKRFMLGVGAGRANISAQVNLSDARTGKELGSYTITGESGGSAFAGGTDDAVKKAAEQVVAVLLVPLLPTRSSRREAPPNGSGPPRSSRTPPWGRS